MAPRVSFCKRPKRDISRWTPGHPDTTFRSEKRNCDFFKPLCPWELNHIACITVLALLAVRAMEDLGQDCVAVEADNALRFVYPCFNWQSSIIPSQYWYMAKLFFGFWLFALCVVCLFVVVVSSSFILAHFELIDRSARPIWWKRLTVCQNSFLHTVGLIIAAECNVRLCWPHLLVDRWLVCWCAGVSIDVGCMLVFWWCVDVRCLCGYVDVLDLTI